MIPAWQKGIIKKIEIVTPRTRRYWIELPETSSFNFKPGQFITLDLPISEQRNKRWRSYSIASAPDGGNVVELIVVHLEGGKGSEYIFNELHVGSELTLRGAQGVFVLPENIDKDLYLICTGTGIAPFRSMLEYIYLNNLPVKHPIHLIFGTRTREDILYENEMRALQDKIPGFSYHIALSREAVEGYYHGYVHPIYESLANPAIPAKFMLCGWRNMIDEAKQRLQMLGFDRKDIQEELYG
jgi:CDP-4-dehydro-6-deoxyglucose reductase